MTQPTGKRGPVSPGASERFGSSQAGVSFTLQSIQQSARGVAEWIDGQATGTGNVPQFAHDHRGGVWGRPLGVGYSFPMMPSAFGVEAVTFCNVPDPRSLTGEDLEDNAANGGYTYVDLWAYASAGFQPQFWVSVWNSEAAAWTAPTGETEIIFPAPGAPPGWVQANAGLHLPPGLVRITATHAASAGWEWLSLVVPQR
jgi:hypothetical protein